MHLFVILFTGGVCLSACWETPQRRHPQEETPLGGDPPEEAHSPSAEHAGRYGQREHYIGGPTHGDKENYSGALFDYANNENIDAKDGNKRKSSELETVQPKKKQALKQNVTAENAIIPLEPNFDDEEDGNMMAKIPLSQNVVQNQLRQAANMFQNATFTNCTITFQMPK